MMVLTRGTSSSWEFFSNLGYEYSIITRKRKFTWTFPVRSHSTCIIEQKTYLVGDASFIWDVVGAHCFALYPSLLDPTWPMKLTVKYENYLDRCVP